jgi:glycosyltransferase involved in cell wall biosynthesis
MNENLLNNEAQKAELEKIEKIKKSLNNIINKESKFLFCVPESQNPVASVYEIYFHATVVKKMGYKVIILVEKGDYVVPTWIEKELTDHEHIPMSNPKLAVGPEDIMIIPEIYSNVMEQTKNLPCIRIGLLQSVDYMTSALIPGTDWTSFGIHDIITTSETLKEWVEVFYDKHKFRIKVYNIGIPNYFEKSKIPQKPIVSLVGRNANEISKVVKLFFSKYPQYNWITFDPMLTKSKPPQTMRRIDFAKRLQENFAAVWIDRIASFGTFPLECMKSGTIPICLKPDIMPEYMIERDEKGVPVKAVEGGGVWTNNFYDLPVLIGDVLIKFLDDNIAPELYDSMNKVASKYTQEASEKSLIEIYQEFINNRIKLFESALVPPAEPVQQTPEIKSIDPQVQKNNLNI